MKRTLLAGIVGAAIHGAASAQGVASTWESRDVVDPITDAKRPIRALRGAGRSAIILKCDSNGPGTVYVHVLSSDYVGAIRGENNRGLTYRFDALPPVGDLWYYDGRDIMLNSRGTEPLRKFMTGLASANKLAIRASKYDGGSVDMVFNVTGAAKVIREVYAGCGDTLPAGI